MMHKTTIGIALFASLGLFGCGPAEVEPIMEAPGGWRGTGNNTYQLIMDTGAGTVCPNIEPPYTLERDWCCDVDIGQAGVPCFDGSPRACTGVYTTEDVCVIPYEGEDDSWICFGSICGTSNEDQECFWVNVLGDHGYWSTDFVCLDLAPTCAGGGGDAEPGPCETGN